MDEPVWSDAAPGESTACTDPTEEQEPCLYRLPRVQVSKQGVQPSKFPTVRPQSDPTVQIERMNAGKSL